MARRGADTLSMEAVLPFAGAGFALGWPLEWVIQQFPRRQGTAPSRRRRLVVALVTALLFALEAVVIGLHARLAPALVLTALAVPAAAIDLRHRIIPDLINLPGAVLVYAVAVAAQPARWLELAVAGLACFLFFFVAHRISPAGMGMGDVKMSLMIGLGLGHFAFLGLFSAFVLSSAVSVGLLVRHGRAGLKVGFPFGPFLAAGTLVALLWGPQLSPHLIG